jgi:serine/threonine protein kinase
LGYAHGHNVIHRDVKPENIMLEAGHAVVADFGIARAVTEAGGERLTETGIAVGTPSYLSPEQAAGESDLDGRSDVYSLGCVLHEMLTGEPPFTGPNAENIIRKQISAEPTPVSVVRPSVSDEIALTIQRALAKAPVDRFGTAEQLADALSVERVTVSGRAVTARPKRPARLIATVGGLAAVIAVIVGVLVREPMPTPTYPRTAIAVLPLDNLTADQSRAYFASGLHDELLTQLFKVVAWRVGHPARSR